MNIGFDGGFHTIKAVSGDRRVSFPSFASRPTRSLFSFNAGEAITVDTSFGRYLVGAEALRKGNGARKETADWVNSQVWLAMFYAACSELTAATQASLSIVAGLPLADYARYKTTLRNRLLGTHTFAREGRRGQTLRIESVRVVPQAWGAVLSILLDAKGRIARPELAKAKLAVIDIGGHTVNYLSVDGLSDVPNETRATERGAWTVMRAVRDFFGTEYPGLCRLHDHQVMQAILDGHVSDAGVPVDLRPIVSPILDDIGQEIVDTAGQYWGERAATFQQIIVCGGGAHLWGEYLRRAFRHTIVLSDPQFANAQGFHNFAAHLGGKG